jgi:hypothetical protein
MTDEEPALRKARKAWADGYPRPLREYLAQRKPVRAVEPVPETAYLFEQEQAA